jgi:RES domain-containing protein
VSSTVWRSDRELTAYRIGSRAHPLLDGGGAASSDGARWNSRGRFVIYAAEHYATALVEQLVKLNAVKLPGTLVFIEIRIPSGASVEDLHERSLRDWDNDDKRASQAFGDAWYDAKRSLLLAVPSLAAPGLEQNILLNQRHPEFDQVVATAPQALRCHPKLRT